MRMMFTFMIFIGTSDSYHCYGSSILDENPNSDPMLLDVDEMFDEICAISAHDLTLHRIVVGVNHQR